jgi:hypothetical protein
MVDGVSVLGDRAARRLNELDELDELDERNGSGQRDGR